ncbi:hypothetical protein J4457_02675 [Candidatus Woesearchaeota archaeon]|nr:hypothetical protein [Candidatus Woesearchaeota archaeon]
MNKKLWLTTIILSLLLIPLVSANVLLPFSFFTLPIFPVIVLLEALIFWWLSKKLLKSKTGFWKSVLITFSANVVTSLVGTFIMFGEPMFIFGFPLFIPAWLNTGLFALCFLFMLLILTVLLEWGTYYLFFRKKKVSVARLFYLSLIANAASYLLVLILIVILKEVYFEYVFSGLELAFYMVGSLFS